jgi:hypothetical protein
MNWIVCLFHTWKEAPIYVFLFHGYHTASASRRFDSACFQSFLLLVVDCHCFLLIPFTMRRAMNRIPRSFTVESDELDCLPFSYMEGSPYLRGIQLAITLHRRLDVSIQPAFSHFCFLLLIVTVSCVYCRKWWIGLSAFFIHGRKPLFTCFFFIYYQYGSSLSTVNDLGILFIALLIVLFSTYVLYRLLHL